MAPGMSEIATAISDLASGVLPKPLFLFFPVCIGSYVLISLPMNGLCAWLVAMTSVHGITGVVIIITQNPILCGFLLVVFFIQDIVMIAVTAHDLDLTVHEHRAIFTISIMICGFIWSCFLWCVLRPVLPDVYQWLATRPVQNISQKYSISPADVQKISESNAGFFPHYLYLQARYAACRPAYETVTKMLLDENICHGSISETPVPDQEQQAASAPRSVRARKSKV